MTTAAARQFVITRYDANAMRSVPIRGLLFDDMTAAARDAARLEQTKRYIGQFLMVDLASAFPKFVAQHHLPRQ